MARTNKILLVDDDREIIEYHQTLLAGEYETCTAGTGREALTGIEKHNPDLILLDVGLPDFNGIEMCKKIREKDISHHIPIIIVTASKNYEDKIKALDAGANDYLNKPIDRLELLLKIKNLLQTKNLHDQLHDSLNGITTINNISDLIMRNFDPNYFDFKRDFYLLLKDYTSQIENSDELPAYIMTAFKHEDDMLHSILYKIADKKLEKIADPLYIDKFQDFAVSAGEKNVCFANLSETGTSCADFQGKFHPQVLEKTGEIRNFISYHGQEVFIIAFNYKIPVNRLMAQALKSFTLHGSFFKVIQDQLGEVRDAYLYSLNSLARAAEVNDQVTGAHIIRVNYSSRLTAQKLGLPPDMVSDIFNMAQMHDIGKIHIPTGILRKPGKLNEEEWQEMRKHPAYGAKIIGDSRYMKVARNICLGHHENFDGSGYPLGRKGEAIPVEARIVRLADVYDSLRSPRHYKPAFSHEKTYDIIVNGSDRVRPEHFDPRLPAIFIEHHQEFARIYEELTAKYENKNEEKLPDSFL